MSLSWYQNTHGAPSQRTHEHISYVMFWAATDGQFRAVADHVAPWRLTELSERRGDHKTFCTESYGFPLDPAGVGPVAQAAHTNEKVVVHEAGKCNLLKRAPLAKEFGIGDITFIPVLGGVLEYGTPVEPKDMAMEEIEQFVNAQGATPSFAYCMFWATDVAEKEISFRVIADYVHPERKKQLRELRGDEKTFVSESLKCDVPLSRLHPILVSSCSFASCSIPSPPALSLPCSVHAICRCTLDTKGDNPVAKAFKMRQQQVVTDAAHCPTFKRAKLAAEVPSATRLWSSSILLLTSYRIHPRPFSIHPRTVLWSLPIQPYPNSSSPTRSYMMQSCVPLHTTHNPIPCPHQFGVASVYFVPAQLGVLE
jgi:hypothetical protein